MSHLVSISISTTRRFMAEHGFETLTEREREILQDMANCQSAKEIARIRGISHRTVEVHKAKIKSKLGARNSAEILQTLYALAINVVTDDKSTSPGVNSHWARSSPTNRTPISVIIPPKLKPKWPSVPE